MEKMMPNLKIQWVPRVIMVNRTFRLAVESGFGSAEIETSGFRLVDSRRDNGDSALYYYLKAPPQSGDYTIEVRNGSEVDHATVPVRTFEELLKPVEHKGLALPRRWPTGKHWCSTKTRQTLQDAAGQCAELSKPVECVLEWWLEQDDATLWRQLPESELPKEHSVNCVQGCPDCGRAIFRFGGFYPWKRKHLPCDFKSECPSCGDIYPSNDVLAGDFSSGNYVDDGYGYHDKDGNLFAFVSSYHRDQTRAYVDGMRSLCTRLRSGELDEEIARRLGVMLLRYSIEELYNAAAPQFGFGHVPGRNGVRLGTHPWGWGQTDWIDLDSEPGKRLKHIGSQHYRIDTGPMGRVMALAYDTIWPLVREDTELAKMARDLGLNVSGPEDVVNLIEQMIAAHIQWCLDGAAATNKPRESESVLHMLRGLDRPDGGDVVEWLYDSGPDKIRVFVTNDFFPDGCPPEATGGYNSIHVEGICSLEHDLRGLRELHPEGYPEERFPSLVADVRSPRIARFAHEITMAGKSFFQRGDGCAPGTPCVWLEQQDKERLEDNIIVDSVSDLCLERIAEFTKSPIVEEIRDAAKEKRHRRIGTTIHDHGGIAILRTDEVPERVALGITYGDSMSHRHKDLLDVQLVAFGRAFLMDMGYPMMWESMPDWEAHWATHNTVWGIVPGITSDTYRSPCGRGRLLHALLEDGLQVLDIEARRWTWMWEEGREHPWRELDVKYRRLIALVETDAHGVAAIDLARITGGAEHWRTCRGIQGSFTPSGVDEKPRGGTVAGPERQRGDKKDLRYPDYNCFAFLDNVAIVNAGESWKGSWQSRFEKEVHLDLHQVWSNMDEILTARGTSIASKPEDSQYRFRTVLWRNEPDGEDDTSIVDLVFEPRVGEATVESVHAIRPENASSMAGGLELVTRCGKSVKLYWAPGAEPEDITRFEDGAEVRGWMSAEVSEGGSVVSFGVDRVEKGCITGLDRDGCTIDVKGILDVEVGDRIWINPAGRGHNYLVESVTELENRGVRLKLDVTSVTGRGPVKSIDGTTITVDAVIIARTGNLDKTRLERLATGEWSEIEHAWNSTDELTIITCSDRIPEGLDVGEWVETVDYVVGDEVTVEIISRRC